MSIRLKDRNAGKAVMLLPMVKKHLSSGLSISQHQSIKLSLRRNNSKLLFVCLFLSETVLTNEIFLII